MFFIKVEYIAVNEQGAPFSRIDVQVTEEMRAANLVYAQLRDLKPDQEYHIKVFPATRLGCSDGSEELDMGSNEEKKTSKIPTDNYCNPSKIWF